MIKQKFMPFLWVLVVIILDQISKYWVLNVFSLVDAKPLLSVLDLRLAMNHGVAFSLFTQYGLQTPWILIGFTGLLSVLILYIMLKAKHESYAQRLAYGLILGGALGNLIDRIRFGAVIDFIDCHIGSHHWPTFNVADSFICLGALLLMIYSYKEGQGS